MQAVIMAGGKGTRLTALTKDMIPKPMLPVAGKSILEWQIEQLRSNGIADIILAVGHLGQTIIDHFGDGKAFGVHIRYYFEKEPLGSAGCLHDVGLMLNREPFFLAYGDVLFHIDLSRMIRFHEEHHSVATLFTHPNAHPYDSDLLETDGDGKVLRFDSKHNDRSNYWYDNCVNAGLYILDSSVCDGIGLVKTDLERDVLMPLTQAGAAVYAYRSPEYVKDVGTPDRIAAAQADVAAGLPARRNLRHPQRAVFLDRDGTVNQYRGLITKPEELELESTAVEAIRLLNNSGYLGILVTNQPVVARGMCSLQDVEIIHNKLKTLLGQGGAYLDDIRFCPHHPDKGYPKENPAFKISCHCRKPGIGMLEDCAQRYHIDLSESWMVGDTTVDVQTGVNAALHTILVMTGEAGRDGKYPCVPELTGVNLLDAVKQIIEMRG